LLKPTTLYEEARRRLTELRRNEIFLTKKLEKSPPGKISIRIVRGYVQYYLRFDNREKTGKYLRKREKSKIIRYLQKAYYEAVLEEITKEIQGLEFILEKSEKKPDLIKQIYSKYPNEVKQNIEPIDCSEEDYVSAWLNDEYEKKIIPPGSTQYTTERGEIVRSKSELNIANALNRHNIPYKYERPLKLRNGWTVHPDFTILIPNEHRVVYWEHRGMMDDHEYVRNTVKRMKEYTRNNIFTGYNLIITEETGAMVLGTDEISAIINKVILGKNK